MVFRGVEFAVVNIVVAAVAVANIRLPLLIGVSYRAFCSLPMSLPKRLSVGVAMIPDTTGLQFNGEGVMTESMHAVQGSLVELSFYIESDLSSIDSAKLTVVKPISGVVVEWPLTVAASDKPGYQYKLSYKTAPGDLDEHGVYAIEVDIVSPEYSGAAEKSVDLVVRKRRDVQTK